MTERFCLTKVVPTDSIRAFMTRTVSVAIGGPINAKPSSVHVGRGLLSQNAQM
jgi:hypothetical protein